MSAWKDIFGEEFPEDDPEATPLLKAVVETVEVILEGGFGDVFTELGLNNEEVRTATDAVAEGMEHPARRPPPAMFVGIGIIIGVKYERALRDAVDKLNEELG